MSAQDVQIVRGMLDAWNRRDREVFDDFLNADAEWEPAGPAAVEAAVFRGKQEITDALFAVWEIWQTFLFEEVEIHDLHGIVLWLGYAHMEGAASGLELHQEWGVVARMRDGRAAHVKTFIGWDAARAAAGVA